MVKSPRDRASPGFTLIELLVVLAIVSMLLTLAVPRYFQSVENSKGTVLAENLRQTRELIDKFYGDTGRYPNAPDELVKRGYFKSLPYDPIIGSASAGVIVVPRDGLRSKVYDLSSSAQGVTMQRHVAEDELIACGLRLANALQTFASATPAGQSSVPKRIEDLLLDPRHPKRIIRHLRRIEIDPMTGTTD